MVTGAQWVSVMAFDQNAIDAADKLLKGAKLYVEGSSLSVTEWSGQDGREASRPVGDELALPAQPDRSQPAKATRQCTRR